MTRKAGLVWWEIRRGQFSSRKLAVYFSLVLAFIVSIGWARALAGNESPDVVSFTATRTVVLFVLSVAAACLVGGASLFTPYARRQVIDAVAEYAFNAFLWTLLLFGVAGLLLGVVVFRDDFLSIGEFLKVFGLLK